VSPRRLNLIIITVAVIVILSSAVALLGRPPQQVEVQIVGAYDSSRLNRFDHLVVKLRNLDSPPFRPVFFIVDGTPGGYKAWEIVEGPQELSPGEEALYTLKSPFVLNALPPNRAFVILVLDADNYTLKAKSRLHYFEPSSFTPLRNPNLYYWIYDVMKGCSQPFAWSYVSCRDGVEEVAAVMESDGSAKLLVANLTRNEGEWVMSGLWQTVELPGVLTIKVKPMFSTPLSSKPSRVVGVEVGFGSWDWGEHRRVSNYSLIPYQGLWILFTNETSEPRLIKSDIGEGLMLYFVPVNVSEWNTVVVNVSAVFHEIGWDLPEPQPYMYEGNLYIIRRAELTIFVAKYPWDAHPTELLEAYFDYVDETPYSG